MNKFIAGLASRFFTFCRLLFSEILIESPSARNQTSLSWGRPSGPIVARVATCESRRSRWLSGMLGIPPCYHAGAVVVPRAAPSFKMSRIAPFSSACNISAGACSSNVGAQSSNPVTAPRAAIIRISS